MKISYMFFLKRVIILCHTCRSTINFHLTFRWGVHSVHFSLNVDTQMFQNDLLKSLSFLYGITFASFLKNGYICLGLLLDYLFCSVDLCVHPFPILYYFDYYSFIVIIWNHKVSSFFFKIVLIIQGTLQLPIYIL